MLNTGRTNMYREQARTIANAHTVRRVPVSASAGDDQRVDVERYVAERCVGRQQQSARGADRRSVAGRDADLVAGIAAACGLDQLLGTGEDLEGSADVEALNVGVGDDHDLAG